MRVQRAGRRIGSFDRTYEGLKRGPLRFWPPLAERF